MFSLPPCFAVMSANMYSSTECHAFHKLLKLCIFIFYPIIYSQILNFFLSVWFSTSTFQFFNFLNALDLCFMKYTHIFLEKSSMKVNSTCIILLLSKGSFCEVLTFHYSHQCARAAHGIRIYHLFQSPYCNSTNNFTS